VRRRAGLAAEARVVPNPLPAGRRPLVIGLAVAAVVLIAVLALTGVLRADGLAAIVIVLSGLAAVVYFVVILTSRGSTAWSGAGAGVHPMFVASAAFWSLYQRQFTVVTIYSDERLDRHILGWEMPVAWVQPTRSSSSCSRACSPRCGPGSGRASRPHQSSSPSAPRSWAWPSCCSCPWPPADGQRAAARADRHPVRLHHRGAAALARRAGIVDQAGSGDLPHPDGGAVLHVDRAGHGHLRGARRFYSPDHETAYFGILGGVAIVLGAALLAITPMLRRLMGGVR
jgi:POT family proton-dependent oligopeptide transporter